MKYYVDENDNLHGFEEDGSQDHLIKEGMTPITQEEFESRTQPEPAEPKYFTYKNDMWPRCTEAEAEVIDAQIEQAPVKMRRMFNDANKIEHNNEYFPLLRENMIAEFGEQRTDEILAPSNGG